MLKSKIELLIVDQTIFFRKKNEKTQRDIAKALKVSAGYIGQVESENSPSMYSYSQLNELAKFLKCSPKDFMPESPV